MSGQKAKNLSIVFRLDDGIIEHNNRNFIADNVLFDQAFHSTE